MKRFLNIIVALFLLFSIAIASNVFSYVSKRSDKASVEYFSEDPKVKAATVTYEMAPTPEVAYSVDAPSTVINNSIYTDDLMLAEFFRWKSKPEGLVAKVEIIPDTYFEEDAQFLKRLNVSENGLIEGSLAIGGGLRVDDDATFESKVTIDDEEVEINGVEYYFPDEQAENNGYVLSNDGSGNLIWSDVNEFTTGVSSLTGTANQIAVSSATGDVTLSIPSTFIVPGTIEVTGNSTFNGTATFNNTTVFDGSVTFNDPVDLGSVPTVADNNQVLTDSGGTISAIDTTNWDKDSSDDFSGIVGTDNRIARFNAAGDNIEDGSINDDYSGIAVEIDSSGNVGIGTTVPGSRLAVSGGATIGSGYASYVAPTNGLSVQGFVGIGTTASLYNFDVNGAAYIDQHLVVNDGIFITAGEDSGDYISAGSYGSSSNTLYIGNESILASGDIGSTLQGYDAGLASIAGLTTSANQMIYTTGSDTYATTSLSAFGRNLIDDADAATARGTLGLGTIATQNSNSVSISGGSITGITDLAIADGGTGASDAATARSNLGLTAGSAGDIWVEKAGDTMSGDLTITGGNLSFDNGTSNILDWSTSGVAAPTFTTRSAGTKMVLYPSLGASSVDYALGIQSSSMWFSVPTSSQVFRFYAGTTEVANLTGGGDLQVDGSVTAASFSGSGSGLTALNASNLSSGTVPDARISGSYTGLTNITGSGTATFASFSGSGAGLTALNASNLSSGTVPDARISGSYTGLTNITGSGTATFASFSGSGASLTALNASNLSSGTVPSARVSGAYTGITDVGTLSADLRVDGTNGIESRRGMHGGYNNSSPGSTNWGASIWSIGSSWNGSGYGSSFTTGSYGLAWLRDSHPSVNSFSDEGLHIYRNSVLVSAIGYNGAYFASGVQASSFSGSGASLTALNASNLSSGTVPDARITGAYTGLTSLTGSGTATFGSFSGSGASLTALNASNLSSGTVPDARISGSYTGMTNLTGSGNVDFARFFGNTGDSSTAPSFSWTTDTNSGLYSGGADIVALSTAGVQRLRIAADGTVSIGNMAANTSNTVVISVAGALQTRTVDPSVWSTALVEASGTPSNGYIGRWGSSTTLGTSLLYDSGSAVGLNDTTPTEGEFVVQGGANQAIYSVSSGGTTSAVQGINNTVGGIGIEGSSNAGYGVYGLSASTGRGVVSNNTAGGSSLYCFTSIATGCAGDQAWFNASDRRLKKDIEPISNALEKLLKLEGVTYVMKKDKTESRNMGFIAQDVLPYAPEVVRFDELEDHYGMQTGQLTALIVEAVKEQQVQIDNLGVNAEGNLTLFGQVVQLQETQNQQASAIVTIQGHLSSLQTLVDSLSAKLDALTNRLNKFDEIMAWTQGVGDSIASVIFKVPTIFSEMAFFNAPIKVNADTSETIEIPSGTQKAKITFTKEFPENPSIYISFVDGIPVAHEVIDVTGEGFTISFDDPTIRKFKIQWLAILRDKSGETPSVEIIGSQESQEDIIEEESSGIEDEEETIEPEVVAVEEIAPSVSTESVSSGIVETVESTVEPGEEDTSGIVSSSSTQDSASGIEIGGIATIKAGEQKTEVETSELNADSVIEVSSDGGELLKVNKVAESKFEISLDTVYSKDVIVKWVISN